MHHLHPWARAVVACAIASLTMFGCSGGGGSGTDAGTSGMDAGTDGSAPDSATPDAGGPPIDAGPVTPVPGCNPELGIECDGDWRGTNPRTGMEFCSDCDPGRCCSPQRGRFMCVDRSADGTCPAADIFVDTDRIVGEYTVSYDVFEPGDCAIVEGCVGGPGIRRLLRFDTWTPNQGNADLFLGRTPPDGMETPTFDWSECHGHHHFNTYAEYELLDSSGAVTATGHKQAFCLLDYYSWPDPRSSRASVYDCDYQGIQRGWQDVYGSHLDCQWIDVTGVPPGDYDLHIALNTSRLLAEEDYDNNEAIVEVTIPPDPPDVDVTLPCTMSGIEGLRRECGWTREGEHTCTPDEFVSASCSAACEAGSCTGDPVMRVCDATSGFCTTRYVIASNDDADCSGAGCTAGSVACCPRAQFRCPASGRYVVYTAPFQDGEAATCSVVVGPGRGT